MRTDTRIDMCIVMRTDMRIGMHIDMHTDMLVDMRVVDTRADMCVNMCVSMCVDMRTETCADVRWACVRHRREAARAIRPPLCKMASRTIRPRLDRGSAATRWRQHSVRTETRQCQHPDSSEPTLVRPPLARCNACLAGWSPLGAPLR